MSDVTVEASPAAGSYPVDLTIDYPERELNRLTTLLRIFTVIPIAIVLVLITGGSTSYTGASGTRGAAVAGIGFLVLPTLLMLLFRQKYPRWWFDWNVALAGFAYRVGAYLALMRDEYLSTDDEQAVHLTIPYPDAAELNRWLPLVKWLLAIPHYIVLFFSIAAFVCIVVAWFAILFTGGYPRALFDLVLGVQRWQLRVLAYAVLLVTDTYPPFRLSS